MSTKVKITLDKSKTFSGCHGDRAPDDPHYRVHNWQGQMVGKAMVLLPFDAEGNLVPDDGRTEPYAGLVDGKPVMHQPLYTKAMRELVERKMKRQVVAQASAEPDEDDAEAGAADSQSLVDEVNFVAWLKGEGRYEWSLLQVAAKQRYSRQFTSKTDMVRELVLDEKLVREDEVCPALAKLLPVAATA